MMSQFSKTGMSTYYDQDNDRQKWFESVFYRKKLIERLGKRGIKVERPDEMKLTELEDMFVRKRGSRK